MLTLIYHWIHGAKEQIEIEGDHIAPGPVAYIFPGIRVGGRIAFVIIAVSRMVQKVKQCIEYGMASAVPSH